MLYPKEGKGMHQLQFWLVHPLFNLKYVEHDYSLGIS